MIVAAVAQLARRWRWIAALAVAAAAVVYRGELAAWIAGDRPDPGGGAAFYTCSMDPSVHADRPGMCPICGMALTPVSEADRASGAVRVAPAARSRLGLAVAPVERKALRRFVIAAGTVAAGDAGAAPVTRTSGAPRVPAGPVAGGAGAVGGSPARRAAGRAAGGAGASAAPPDRTFALARVYRGDPAEVKPGQVVAVSAPDLPLDEFAGTVEALIEGEPGAVRIAVDDRGGALRPGARFEARITVELAPQLVAPASAVIYAGPRRIVFVDRGGGQFAPREVKLGVTAGGDAQVLSGLAAGDLVVVKGTFLLAADSRIRSDGALWSGRIEPPRGAGKKQGNGLPRNVPAEGMPLGGSAVVRDGRGRDGASGDLDDDVPHDGVPHDGASDRPGGERRTGAPPPAPDEGSGW